MMTEKRRAELEQYRQQAATKDSQRAVAGQLIDGIMQIEEGLNKAAAAKQAMPELILAGGDSRSRGKRLAVRR